MSRRKVKGLTRTGRQVSEDPDLDSLLSTLSPEDMEALEKEIETVPDLRPEDGKIIVEVESLPAARSGARDQKLEGDPRGKRESSLEGELKKESRKQEYLRKMGLSQEGEEDSRTSSEKPARVSTGRDAKEDGRNKSLEVAKGEPSRLSGRYRSHESRESDGPKEKDKQEDNKLTGRRETRESSKTKDMISKLQEKKEGSRERKEESRRRDDKKTKDILSKFEAKGEERKEKERKPDIRTQGRVSQMLEKQNKESKAEEWKTKSEEKKCEDKNKAEDKNSVMVDQSVKQDKVEKRTDREELVNHSDHVKEKERKTIEVERREDVKAAKLDETGKVGNCLDKKNSNQKVKEDEEDDEDSSMFDELMEQVHSNDPTLTELNVNNSEVIKTKTLIEFAQALHKNTHITKVALANCRADDHVAYAFAGTLRANRHITSLNVDSNHLTGKGILALIQALQHNSTLTELRFQNQRHICGGKTEMEMTKILKDNTTLLKLGYHFELAGPRMTTTNILSRNMDRQRQKRLQEQKLAQANGDKKETLEVPKNSGGGSLRGSPKASPKPSPMPSPVPSPKLTPKGRGVGAPPPPPPPPGVGPPPPPPPMLDIDSLRNSLTPVSQRNLNGKGSGGRKNSRDQLLASIRGSNIKQLKKVPVPKWLQ
ncbi:uncharacterized protein lmod1b [Synchiropus picturatus]